VLLLTSNILLDQIPDSDDLVPKEIGEIQLGGKFKALGLSKLMAK
jgi:hypothetical protein